ncbi:MAG: PaaI family thioesterase, partial [Candidatus Limnocylindrales bacterium]
MAERELSLQERYAPHTICFGCGPANDQGLHIRSFANDDTCTCDFTPLPHHQAFPGVLSGGIIGVLMDCHSNWAAASHLMRTAGLDHPQTTVTADFHVRLLKPTPADAPVRLVGRVVESTERRATVETDLFSGEELT